MMYTRSFPTLPLLIILSITSALSGAVELHDAAEMGDVRPINTTNRNKQKETVLHVAAERRRTPLHSAADAGHLSVVKKLVIARAQISARDSKNVTPLHAAAAGNHYDVAAYLLEHEAAIDVVDDSMCTPLYVAIVRGHPKIVALLCTHGANLLINKEILLQILEAGFTYHVSKRAELLASFNAFLEKCGPQRIAEVEAASIAAMVSANSKIKRDRSVNSNNSVTPEPPTNCNNSPLRLRKPISTDNRWRAAGYPRTRLAQIKKGPE